MRCVRCAAPEHRTATTAYKLFKKPLRTFRFFFCDSDRNVSIAIEGIL
jgi:hypothetical protein